MFLQLLVDHLVTAFSIVKSVPEPVASTPIFKLRLQFQNPKGPLGGGVRKAFSGIFFSLANFPYQYLKKRTQIYAGKRWLCAWIANKTTETPEKGENAKPHVIFDRVAANRLRKTTSLLPPKKATCADKQGILRRWGQMQCGHTRWWRRVVQMSKIYLSLNWKVSDAGAKNKKSQLLVQK